MYPKNAASPEPIDLGAVVQISDGAVQTAGVTVRIKPIGVAEADGAGTTSYSTDGIVIYTPTQAETNYTSFILIAKKTGCIPVSKTVVTTDSATPGTVKLAAVTHTGATVPTVTTTGTATNVTNAPTNGDFTATMKTSIGTAVAASAVASVTGNVAGSVGSIAAGGITATSITDGSFTAAKFAAGFFTTIWSSLTSGMNTVGSIGKLLVDNINATISSRAVPGDAMDLVDVLNEDALDGIGVVVESHLLDEGDSQMLVNAIVEAIGNTNVSEAALVAAIRVDLERNAGYLDLVKTILQHATYGNAALKTLLDTKASQASVDTKASSFELSFVSVQISDLSNQLTSMSDLVTDVITIVADIPTNGEMAIIATGIVDGVGDLLDLLEVEAVISAEDLAEALDVYGAMKTSDIMQIFTLADTIEEGWNLQDTLRITSAVQAGPSENLGNDQWGFYDLNGTKIRVTATIVDEERTEITTDAT